METLSQPASTTPAEMFDTTELDHLWMQLTADYDRRALARLGRWLEALRVALRTGRPPVLPKNPLQRPRLLYLDGLEDAEWFDPGRFDIATRMQAAFKAIELELQPDLDPRRAADFTAYFADEPQGAWRVRKFFDNGERVPRTFQRYPLLGHLLDDPELPSDVGECQVSSLAPGGHIRPHYGPINGILVGHLALRIPAGDCRIRVGASMRGWERGECFVFDDTFEHEAWNRTGEVRYVLLFNVWHPDLTALERHIIKLLYPRCRELLNAMDGV